MFAYFGDYLFAEGANVFGIVAIGFQLFAYPAWDFRAAGVGEARQFAVVGDRHDARYHRDVHAQFAHALDEVEVAVGDVS